METNNSNVSFLNTTDVETVDSTPIGIVYLVTSLAVMFSNSIVMTVVVTSAELHLPTLWNIAFMALCDFSYGLYFLIFSVPSAFMNRFAYPEVFIAPSSCLQTLLFGQNVMNIAVVTVDRYLSVCWPLKYTNLMTAKRFIIAIVITVIINACRLGLIIDPKVDVYYNANIAMTISRFATLASAGASVGVPFITVIIITGFLIKLMLELARSRRRVHTATVDVHGRQFTVTVCLSTGLFCLSYIPTCINVTWNFLAGTKNVSVASIKFGVFCQLSNSLWNIVIYAATYKPFRDAFLRLLCRAYYRKKRQTEVQVISRNYNAWRNE